MFSVLRFQDEMLFNKSLTHTCFKNTTRGVDSDGRPGEHPAVAKLETPCANSSWIYIRWHTGRSPPPHSTLFQSLSLSVPSIPPCVQQLTGADPPADQFPQHVAARSVVLWFSVLLTSFPPDQETKEERKQETLAPPSLYSQAACAST